MRLNWKSFFFIASVLFFTQITHSQTHKVIESSNQHLVVEFNLARSYSVTDTIVEGRTYQKIHGEDHGYRNPGDPWTPEYVALAGIPLNSNPTIKILEQKQSILKNKFIIALPEEDPELVKQDFEKINHKIYSKNEFYPSSPASIDESYIVRYAKILPIKVAPFQFNPVTRDLVSNSKVVVRVDFNIKDSGGIVSLTDAMTNEFLETSVVNPDEAKTFAGKIISYNAPQSENGYWYNPNKNYFKIYVKEKNVYRLTYEELVSSGAQLGSNTPTNKLEMFNEGQPVPIEVFDNNSDLVFNAGDYLKFVGFPPTATEFCKLNIYNLSNVYWFSYESDSTGVNFNPTHWFVGNFSRSYFANLTTLHFEKDSLYERLGYIGTDTTDYWFWDKATSRNQAPSKIFNQYFETFPGWYLPDSHYVRLRVALQGMNRESLCAFDHNAYISINEKLIGNISWNGQSKALFDKRFYASADSVPIFPGNQLYVEVRGDSCTYIDDEIRINWFEFEYWRGNSAFGNYYSFKNFDKDGGINRYNIFDWEGSDMRIYIPEKNKVMYIPTSGSFQQFVDTVTTATEYFLASTDYYASVDSIVANASSDLRNSSNGSDYIIITHNKFTDIANQLAAFRQNNFPDESIANPRIKVIDVQQIYDEFSFGLLEPKALHDFTKHAFENWSAPAPTYVVLLGDMSYDYRKLLVSSRPNFIPSIPYYSYLYGQAASDNLIVAVSGNDSQPDLAIGRLSIETIAEGNILLQKLIDYPDDPAKPWQQNVLFLASGLDLQDELRFGFNDASFSLGNTYVKPEGIGTSYVFRYPSRPEHEPFQGEGPKIREKINEGAVLVNYYGHGGGYQWDLVFTNDDIFLLENEGRLPVILSVTCYTAHFDNQDVFGEQFNKVLGKGSIGFYGSAGLTYWTAGKTLNRELFKDIFSNRNYIIGKAIMNSKNNVIGGGVNNTQINLLTYLGDPVMKLALPQNPDFEIRSDDITLNPENPLLGDSIQVKINISNWGTVFPNDSVVVELFAELSDTSYQIGSVKRPNFPEKDSVYFTWIPNKGGLYTLTAKVNETEIILEDDHSDNIGTALFIIFNISEPNTLTPVDGFVSTSNQIEFNFSDIGHYIPKALEYYIEIDTSFSFSGSPLYSSGKLIPERSMVKWNSPNLTEGIYFWRARIFEGANYGNWSTVRSFSIMSGEKEGYYAHGNILKTFGLYNMNYVEESKSLVLNTEPLPARPSSKTFLNNFLPVPQVPDSVELTALATDGTYLYAGNIWFYARGLTDAKSMIYKFGTGENGTIEGQSYGTFSNFRDTIRHSIAYLDGYIYVAIGEPYKIVRINVSTELIDTVDVPSGLIRDNTTLTRGSQYINSDGQYIYNLSYSDSLFNNKYSVRIFDPSNGWELVRPQFELFGTSFNPGFTGFFVHGERIYTAEYFNNYIRRHRLTDSYFEEEFLATNPPQSNFQHYYAWCWDWEHDKIYASVFNYEDTSVVSKFGRFAGYYVDANGTINTNKVGPVAWWNELKYNFVNPSPTGEYTITLLGQNYETKSWDTIQVNVPDSLSLSFVNADIYPTLRLNFELIDSTFQTTDPMELKSVHFDYHPLNDVYVEREDVIFHQDSLLQGYPITFDARARNFGDISADSLNLSYYLNGLDSLLSSQNVVVPVDSFSNQVEYTIDTRHMIFENKLLIYGINTKREYFYFNNLLEKEFYVARDSTRPLFDVTFDGQEIINNDIVSSTPEIVIKLEDNSPLPLDTTLFTVVHNNKPLRFYQPEVDWSYEGVGTPFIITYTPTLPDETRLLSPPERNTFEVLAKDKSGNFFDSTSYRVTFYVYTENDITQVYNYPNPFSGSTNFTFILQGEDKPSEVEIRIFTIAGRLIRDIKLSSTDLITNFNKIYWDGNDQDGDPIGNGVYLYKVIATFPDQTKTITQKLAKVR